MIAVAEKFRAHDFCDTKFLFTALLEVLQDPFVFLWV